MRMSNAELQEAIAHALQEVEDAPRPLEVDLIVHARALLNEQRRRAEDRTELTLAQMETTVERAEFDARIQAQDPPYWVDTSE